MKIKWSSSRILITVLITLSLTPLACNLPGSETSSDTDINNAAAQTVAAQFTQAAQGQDSTEIPIPATSQSTLTPTETQTLPTVTPACTNKARFIDDVTIPDDTVFATGVAFVKTWRIKNVGTCTWDTSYALVFSSGNIMGANSSANLSGTVPPNGVVDISVNMTAPATNGTHKGNWKMRSKEGTIFGFGVTGGDASIFVKIIVGPTPTPAPVTKTFAADSMGSASEDGNTYNDIMVGDGPTNFGLQGFVTFDISAIPDGATIQKVKLDVGTPHSIVGDPFGDLGCLRVFIDAYGTLGAGDYTHPPASGADWRFCNVGQLSDTDKQTTGSSSVQEVVNALPSNVLQIRLQYNENETDFDLSRDMFKPTNPRLFITYVVP